jgi:hypothetical protein
LRPFLAAETRFLMGRAARLVVGCRRAPDLALRFEPDLVDDFAGAFFLAIAVAPCGKLTYIR